MKFLVDRAAVDSAKELNCFLYNAMIKSSCHSRDLKLRGKNKPAASGKWIISSIAKKCSQATIFGFLSLITKEACPWVRRKSKGD
jgi:hypothetical protein